MLSFAVNERRRASRKKRQASLPGQARIAAMLASLAWTISLLGCGDGTADAQQAAKEILQIQQAATLYYRDNGAWPIAMAVLRRTGYLGSEPAHTPWQSPYRLRLGKRGLSVLTAVENDAQYETLKRYLSNSQRRENQVTVPLLLPARWPSAPGQRDIADKTDAPSGSRGNAGPRSNAQRLLGR